MMKNIFLNLVLFSFIYLELVFKIINHLNIFNISSIFVIAFTSIFSIVLVLILELFKRKQKLIVSFFILLIFSIYFSISTCLHNIYKFYFQFSSIALADQVGKFASDGVKVILNNWQIILLFIPEILLYIFRKHVDDKKTNSKLLITILSISLLVYLPSAISQNGYVNTVFASNNMIQIVNKNGVLSGLGFDIFSIINSNDAKIEVIQENIEENKPKEESIIEYGNNSFDIDYLSLNDKTEDNDIKTLNEYITNLNPTEKNKYSSYFKDKNLILFMAESFNSICVDPNLTPTLYKLVNNGFSFSNFYTPTIYSTIGGEFSELTSLFPDLGQMPNTLSIFRSDRNNYPMGIGNLFKQKGYKTYAYHDSAYDFQDRNIYLNNLGFDNYNACGLGLENRIRCSKWPASDIEMIEQTFNDYIDDDKFLVFYATVSGHGPYVFDEKDNIIAPKYEEELRRYYGDRLGTDSKADMLMAYEAGQIELDKAIETLLNKLQACNKLDDTVIALVGDHHPYYLTEAMSIDDYNKLSTYERDETIEIYHSNFILYNSAMQTVQIDKVGSQLDVIPTIYNLFGVEYDSRLFMGIDLLSTSPSIAIMADNSWVNDFGRYYANSGIFEANDNSNVNDSYIERINKKINNMQQASRLIMKTNYYEFINENKKD